MAFGLIEPFGDVRADVRAGFAAWRLAEAWGSKAKLEAFNPEFGATGRPSEQSAEEMKAVFDTMRRGK